MEVYFAMNCKISAETTLHFELYPRLCIYDVELY